MNRLDRVTRAATFRLLCHAGAFESGALVADVELMAVLEDGLIEWTERDRDGVVVLRRSRIGRDVIMRELGRACDFEPC